jgi:ureidoglycolate lyase
VTTNANANANANANVPDQLATRHAGRAAVWVDLRAEPITQSAFALYGTLLLPAVDGKPFDSSDAQLVLSKGVPRFYIMTLPSRDMSFRHITRHLAVTQCLASVGGRPWMIAVAPPDEPDNPQAKPDMSKMRAFRIQGDQAIMLARSTWHIGPFFEADEASFFNLELSDTNQTDHHSCYLDRDFGKQFRLVCQ